MNPDEKRAPRVCVGHDEGPCEGGPGGVPATLGQRTQGDRCGSCRMKKFHQDSLVAGAGVDDPKASFRRPPMSLNMVIPASWGQIPETSPYRGCMEWVMGNRLLVVQTKAEGAVKIDLSFARSPAPSMFALQLLDWSTKFYTHFMQTVHKVQMGEDDEETTAVMKRERMDIGEIRRILEEFKAG